MEYDVSPLTPRQKEGMEKEWLLTNRYGDYASGTVLSCNTRRYHGLLAVQTAAGRRMLLSALEDSLLLGGASFPLSVRVHPGKLWPEGWKTLERAVVNHDAASFFYRFPGKVRLKKSLAFAGRRVRISYELEGAEEAMLEARPLANVRNIDYLHPAEPARVAWLAPLDVGFSYRPDSTMPGLCLRACCGDVSFRLAPDWYYRVLYPVEKGRGYDWSEDLLMPGVFQARLAPNSPVVFEAWADPAPESDLPPLEPIRYGDPLLDSLRREADRFLVRVDGAPMIPAGYHWFGPWGRDTLISLPGLTFVPERLREAEAVLGQICASARHGLIPNLLGPGNAGETFNAADASLWFLYAVHQLYLACPEERAFIVSRCWPVVKEILHFFHEGTMPDAEGNLLVKTNASGLLHTGSAHTQLTWMDAMADGEPVTPRHGFAVELNALWFNALSFALELGKELGDVPSAVRLLPTLRQAFRQAFIPAPEYASLMHGGLFDTWNPQAPRDMSIRPNQIFAVSVPYSPLEKEEQASVARCVRECLLTPFGLRTLAPSDPAYKPRCQGNQRERDLAYHQGTVWPWPLGAYADALLKTDASDSAALELLCSLTPLFTQHLNEAGLGSLSEIFDADPPHAPGGCIAQAWSTAEGLRLLLTVRKRRPQAWARWRQTLSPKNQGFDARGSKEWICES